MELEQRVKTLEYEMKVLKSEIQRTLLDIQEQILVHYYPTLRSEEDAAPEAARQAVQTLRASSDQGKSAQLPPPTPTIVIQPAEEALVPSAAPMPVVRKVTLEEVRGAQTEPVSPDDMTRMSKLLEWALNAAAQIGPDRTKAIIQACAAHQVLTAEMQDVLVRVAPLNRRTPPELVGMREVIQVITQLDLIMGRPSDIEEALALIEEAKIG